MTSAPKLARGPIAILLVLAMACCAAAQGVRTGSGLGMLRRQGEADAEKQRRTDWPYVDDGGRGTQVHVTFDYQDADIIILAYPALTRAQLLEEGNRIAFALGYPMADYVLPPTRTYSPVDIELNKYMRVDGRVHSFRFDLAALGRTLSQSSLLPMPITIRVDGSDADDAQLSLGGGPNRKVGDSTFLALREIPQAARVSFSASIEWYSYLAAAMMLSMLAIPFVMVARMPWIREKNLKKRLEPKQEPSPDLIQKNYDKNWWKTRAISFMAPAVFVVFVLGRKFMESGFKLLPHIDFNPRFMLVAPMVVFGGVLGVSNLIYLIDKRRRASSDPALTQIPELAKAAKAEAPAGFKYMWIMFIPVFLMVLTAAMPWMQTLDPFWRRVVIFSPMIVCFPIMFVLMARSTRQSRIELKPGDGWYETTHEIARQGGVTVKRVVVISSKVCNAYASLFGTVGLTQGLIDRMEPEEIRGIIAHEVGHLRARHVPRTLAISLPLLAVLLGGWFWLTSALEGKVSKELLSLMSGPLVGFFVFPTVMALIVGVKHRKNEREADHFAVEVTGDPETYIRALNKIHTFNETPARLTVYDEAKSTHPSLVNRVKAIREAFGRGSS